MLCFSVILSHTETASLSDRDKLADSRDFPLLVPSPVRITTLRRFFSDL